MNKRRARILVAIGAALLLAVLAPATAEESGGIYLLAGQTPSGDAYQGSAAIAPNGTTFRLKWTRPKPLEQRGYGLQLDNVLGVVADDRSQDYGIVLYRVTRGHLEGVWQGDPGDRTATLGAEVLDGPEGLEGTYSITLGRNPDGSTYSGRVEITRMGAIYLVDWYTPDALRYVGTGVSIGNIFVVGYGAEQRSSVAAYCMRSVRQVEGITADAAITTIGAEILWRLDAPAVEDPTPRLAKIRERGTADCGGPIAQLPSPEPLIVTSR
jgi:hypothetical protein